MSRPVSLYIKVDIVKYITKHAEVCKMPLWTELPTPSREAVLKHITTGYLLEPLAWWLDNVGGLLKVRFDVEDIGEWVNPDFPIPLASIRLDNDVAVQFKLAWQGRDGFTIEVFDDSQN